jgi:hypothetical protein
LWELKNFMNVNYCWYIRWILFNEFRYIEYLAKGSFGEVHNAKWIDYYNSSKNILDILKEVNKNFFINIDLLSPLNEIICRHDLRNNIQTLF